MSILHKKCGRYNFAIAEIILNFVSFGTHFKVLVTVRKYDKRKKGGMVMVRT